MDLSKYTFTARACASKLDEIEPKLGVKFDRKALFDHEQYLVDQSRQGPRLMDVRWMFKIGKTGSGVFFFTSRGGGGEGVKECCCGNHVELTSRELGYGTNALECALNDLDRGIPKIQTLRQPKPAQEKQMTTQDKETIMHEAIARASLVAFAEFIGQPINDINGVFQQARALYGRTGKKIAVVVKIPVDKTKPIEASVVDSHGVSDGVKLKSGAVTLSYWPISDSSSAKSLREAMSGMLQFTKDAIELLTTERAKQTPPPPAKPEPIPYESECRTYIKRLNKELGINLSEDAVLSAGEVARATHPGNNRPRMNYVLSITKASRAASFAVLPASAEVKASDNVVVFSTSYYPSADGLQCALGWMTDRISYIQSELTPPAPSKPALTADDMRPGSVALDESLKIPGRPPLYVFNGKESERQSTDNEGFFAALTSGASNLFLTFQRKADRAQLSKNPRVHVHTSPTPFLPEFNTTISAPIDPTSPVATLTALAERITAENL